MFAASPFPFVTVLFLSNREKGYLNHYIRQGVISPLSLSLSQSTTHQDKFYVECAAAGRVTQLAYVGTELVGGIACRLELTADKSGARMYIMTVGVLAGVPRLLDAYVQVNSSEQPPHFVPAPHPHRLDWKRSLCPSRLSLLMATRHLQFLTRASRPLLHIHFHFHAEPVELGSLGRRRRTVTAPLARGCCSTR